MDMITPKPTWTITCAESERTGSGGWNQEREFGWDELAHLLTTHQPGEKRGSCYVPGRLKEPRRVKENVETLELMVLDVDAGQAFEVVVGACTLLGWRCAVATTHSHMNTRTNVNRQAFEQSGLTAEAYLIEKAHLLPEIAAGAEVVEQGEEAGTIQHQPCPRTRVAIPLARPWRRSDYGSVKQAELVWVNAFKRVSHVLGLEGLDSCSAKLSHPFFFPRYPAGGAEPKAAVLDGPLLDVWSLPAPPGAPDEIRAAAGAETCGGRAPHGTTGGLIGEFNRCFTVGEILGEHGYEKARADRWLAPWSTTGTPGVNLLDDGARVYSHHNNDPLADGFAHDAFDCFRILEHDGELHAALGAARAAIPGQAIDQLNQRHAFTTIGAKAVVLYEKSLAGDDGSNLDFLTTTAFQDLYRNRMIPVGAGDDAKLIPLGRYWLNSPARREVEGVHFDPGGGRPNWFNMWTGLAIEPTDEPQQKAWDLYRKHVEEIICGGDENLTKYVWAWLADIVQNPGRKIGVALALRGGRGTGKGCFVKPLQRILGRHSIQIHNRTQLTGRFNGHLADKLLVFVDEGYWSGDKQGEGVLKGLITEEDISVERKGIDAVRMKNFSRFIIASNEDWVVPAGTDERRFAVLDVGDARAQDHDYFRPIFEQMENGGDAALLRFLLDFDLTDINLRQAPRTGALVEQKLRSLGSEASFWFEVLQEGSLEHDLSSDNAIERWEREPVFVPTRDLHQQYRYFCQGQRVGYPAKRDAFTKALFGAQGVCPGAQPKRPRDNGGRLRGYLVPPLGQCRQGFEQALDAEGGIAW